MLKYGKIYSEYVSKTNNLNKTGRKTSMTNMEQLESIREKMLGKEMELQIREMKEKTLFFLMNQRNYEPSGKLKNNIAIPKYQVEKEYLTEILKELGYSEPRYEEGYDGYYEGTCYIITL